MPTGNCRRPSRAAWVVLKISRQPADFGLGLADHENLLVRAGFVQFLAHPVDVAAEALDRLDLQPAGGFQRRGRHGGRRNRGKLKHPL